MKYLSIVKFQIIFKAADPFLRYLNPIFSKKHCPSKLILIYSRLVAHDKVLAFSSFVVGMCTAAWKVAIEEDEAEPGTKLSYFCNSV